MNKLLLLKREQIMTEEKDQSGFMEFPDYCKLRRNFSQKQSKQE